MRLQAVRAFMAEHAPDIEVMVKDVSTATVPLAAQAHGVEPGQIAKTLSLWVKDQVILVVMAGDSRLDNRKFKDCFGAKPKMLSADEVGEWTGHPVGGVCPFGLARPLPVYADVSLKRYDEVLPAAGAVNAAVRIAPGRMADLVGAQWVDVAQAPENPAENGSA